MRFISGGKIVALVDMFEGSLLLDNRGNRHERVSEPEKHTDSINDNPRWCTRTYNPQWCTPNVQVKVPSAENPLLSKVTFFNPFSIEACAARTVYPL